MYQYRIVSQVIPRMLLFPNTLMNSLSLIHIAIHNNLYSNNSCTIQYIITNKTNKLNVTLNTEMYSKYMFSIIYK